MKLAGDSGAKAPNYRHPRTSTFEQCTPQVLPLARRADLLGLHRGTHFAFCHPFVCGQWEFLQRTGGGGGEGGRAHSPQTPSCAVLSSAPCRSLFQALMTSPRCPALGRRDNNASCPVTALGTALPCGRLIPHSHLCTGPPSISLPRMRLRVPTISGLSQTDFLTFLLT